jgi:hypothetical protein
VHGRLGRVSDETPVSSAASIGARRPGRWSQIGL